MERRVEKKGCKAVNNERTAMNGWERITAGGGG